ncbi:MAG: DUF2158 domain-containing protein [Bryobacteraceae bacterium]|jgi:uncharacterized protein YodC (DUF2158 family)
MPISLKPGTVVQLKSGGPKMTVVGEHQIMGVPTGQVYCEWFDAKNASGTGAFAETSLKVVTDAGA